MSSNWTLIKKISGQYHPNFHPTLGWRGLIGHTLLQDGMIGNSKHDK